MMFKAAKASPDFQTLFGQAQATLQSKLDVNSLTGVGQSFGKAVSDALVKEFPDKAAVIHQNFDSFIPQLDASFHQAFALAIGQTFQIGVFACVIAVVMAVFMKDIPLRKSFGPSPAVEGAPAAPPAAGEPKPA